MKANQVGDKNRGNMMGWTKGLRGGKHEMYEGGVRIPFIVRWPGKVPVDAVNETSILSGLDFLPTLCHLTGTPYDEDQFEGLDVSDIWLGGDRNPQRFLYWKKQYPTALDGEWKYHVNKADGDEFYDLVNDPNETTNVIAGYPKKQRPCSIHHGLGRFAAAAADTGHTAKTAGTIGPRRACRKT